MSLLSIRVPATSANLGPGFDMFGVALSLHTSYHFNFDEAPGTTALFDRTGAPLPIPEEHNLIATAFRSFRDRNSPERAGEPRPGFSVRVENDVPTGRGFGSSASALVAGIAAARYSLDLDVFADGDGDVQILNELEGHPDNVAPARLGGFVLGYAQSNGRIITIRKRLPDELGLAVLFPNFNISTHVSRTKLPESIPMPDCLMTMKGVLLWREYLEDGNVAHLIEALASDRLHEPYRGQDIPGFQELRDRAQDIGLYGVTISGSGPSLLVYFDRSRESEILPKVQQILESRCADRAFQIQPCSVDYDGLCAVTADAVAGESRTPG